MVLSEAHEKITGATASVAQLIEAPQAAILVGSTQLVLGSE